MTLTGILSVEWWGQKPGLPEREVIRETQQAAGQLRVTLMSEVINVKICLSSHSTGRELCLTRAVQEV